MKRILFLLLLTVSVYGQNPSRFAKIQITGNSNSVTATKVNVQEANGEVNTQAINTGFNKNFGLNTGDVVGATTLLNQYSTVPVDWTATTFASGQVVFYGGKQWISNASTVAGDVPSISSKWDEITFEALSNKTVIVDAIPTDGSDNAVSSNGVFDALATKAPISSVHNPVTIGTANGLSLSTQVLSLGLSSSTTTGALSSTDFNTFAGKQNALTNPVTGTGVNGQISFWNGTGTQTGDIGLFWNNSTKRLQLLTSDSRLEGGDSVGRFILGNSTTSSYIEFSGNTRASTPNDINIVTTSGLIKFFFNSAERARFNNAGRFLLGQTTDNLTDIAQFNGSAIATAWKVTGGTTAQYQTGTGSLVDFNSGVRTATLTGFASGSGTVSATDNVLQAIQKLNGNDALKANLSGAQTFTGVQTFSSSPIVPTAVNANEAINKGQLDTAVGTSGSYTPTITGVANITSSSLSSATYIKTGNIVSVSISYNVNPTTSSVNSEVKVTLPISRTVSTLQYIGVSSINNSSSGGSVSGIVYTNTNTNEATVYFKPLATGAHVGIANFQYSIN